MDEFTPTPILLFQPFDIENYDCDGNNSLTSLRDLYLSQLEMKSYSTVVMPIMVIGAVSFEKQLADMGLP